MNPVGSRGNGQDGSDEAGVNLCRMVGLYLGVASLVLTSVGLVLPQTSSVLKTLGLYQEIQAGVGLALVGVDLNFLGYVSGD